MTIARPTADVWIRVRCTKRLRHRLERIVEYQKDLFSDPDWTLSDFVRCEVSSALSRWEAVQDKIAQHAFSDYPDEDREALRQMAEEAYAEYVESLGVSS